MRTIDGIKSIRERMAGKSRTVKIAETKRLNAIDHLKFKVREKEIGIKREMQDYGLFNNDLHLEMLALGREISKLAES